MTVSNKPAPFENVNFNLSNLYQAVHHNPAITEAHGPNPPPATRLTETQLYQFLLPNMHLNGNRNINFYQNNALRFCLFEWGLENEILRRIRCALDFTHVLFHCYQQKLMHKYIPRFHESLGAGRQELSPGKIKKVHEKIQQFYEVTQPFLREVLTRSNERLTKIFQRHFCPDCFKHMADLQKCHDIIALQGVLGMKELPVKLILNVAFDEKVDDNELNEFVGKLSSSNVDVRMLHRALKAVVEYASHIMILPRRVPDLGILERRLFEKKPELFTQHDPKHLEWRNSLQEGSELRTLSYTAENKVEIYRILLGKQIERKPSGFDNNIFFEIKECYRSEQSVEQVLDEPEAMERLSGEEKRDSSSQVLWTTINEAIPFIRHSINNNREETGGFKGLKPSTIQFIDPKGRFAFVEKLHMQPLGSSKSPLDNRNQYLQVVSNWIKWLIKDDPKSSKEPLTPVPLTFPQNIMFNQSNILTSVKLLNKEETFRFVPFEEFVLQISNGELETFKKLMISTGLASMKDAQFIRQAAMTAFEPEKFDLNSEKLKGGFQDKAILHLAQTLRNDLLKMRDDCIKELECPPQPKLDSNKLKFLEKLILDHYEKSGKVTILMGTMRRDVIESFARPH